MLPVAADPSTPSISPLRSPLLPQKPSAGLATANPLQDTPGRLQRSKPAAAHENLPVLTEAHKPNYPARAGECQ
eukprot:12756734-Alexandrium_andersonii.AAC.1